MYVMTCKCIRHSNQGWPWSQLYFNFKPKRVMKHTIIYLLKPYILQHPLVLDRYTCMQLFMYCSYLCRCYYYFICILYSYIFNFSIYIKSYSITEQDDCIKLPDTCDDENPIVSECSEEAICGEMRVDSTSQFVPTKEVCRVATRNCRSGSASSICPAGQLYVKSEKKCIPGKIHISLFQQ